MVRPGFDFIVFVIIFVFFFISIEKHQGRFQRYMSDFFLKYFIGRYDFYIATFLIF